jgi:hypothetical protein
MMTKQHLAEFLKNVLTPNLTSQRALLIVDSWSTYKDKENILNNLPNRVNLLLEQIPAHNTSRHQPLDVSFFRYYKSFFRRISERISIETNGEYAIHQRDNVFKMQSIVYNQFCCPLFTNLIKFAWHKAGYVDERPGQFITPLDFCFSSLSQTCSDCDTVSFIKCAWCNNCYCLKCFIGLDVYDNYHNCNNI